MLEGPRMPAEWERHEACWLALPHLVGEWSGQFESARHEVLALASAIATLGGEHVHLLVHDEADAAVAQAHLGGAAVTLHAAPFGDCWTRDTAPTFLHGQGVRWALRFTFDGWGGKYSMPGDAQVGAFIAETSGVDIRRSRLTLEGGAIDVDGEGTALCTRSCALARNPDLDETTIRAALCSDLGVDEVLWLDEGLLNDHTDGHVDTIARFVAPGIVACMSPNGEHDPNAGVLEDIARALEGSVDARGRRIELRRLPSPGRVEDSRGEPMPASYANFYIANEAVLVPRYGAAMDDDAVEAVGALFPRRRAVGLEARALLSGGGALHCVTQQVPEVTP